MPASDPKLPAAARKPVEAMLHSTARSDDYAWLKDADWQRVMRNRSSVDRPMVVSWQSMRQDSALLF